MPRLILFDYDGVLVESLDLILKMTRRAFLAVGSKCSPSPADVARMHNVTFKGLGRLGHLSQDRMEAFQTCLLDLNTQHATDPPLFPEIGALLGALADHYTLGIVSANATRGVEQVLAREGLGPLVTTVMGGDMPGRKAEKIARAARQLDIPLGQVYMIGDTVSDIREARRAAVVSIAVTWGWHDEARLITEAPDHVVRSPRDLRDYFERQRS